MQEWSVPAWAVVGGAALALLAVTVSVLAVTRLRRRTLRELAAARAEAAELRRRVAGIERRVAAPPAGEAPEPALDPDYVITHLGDTGSPADPVAAPLFADLVLRESVVQAASFAAGVRRALAPETRNRIRFEMRREVKRARKQRRADTKQALRDWQARQRAGAEPAAGAPSRDSAA